MFWQNPKWIESVRKFLIDSHNYKNSVKILPVDFHKPWWHILLKQKKLIAAVVAVSTINNAFLTLIALALAFIIQSGNYWYLLILVVARILMFLLAISVNYFARVIHVQTSGSLKYWATNFFLTVDPVAHSTRSSGAVISKVNRLSLSSKAFLDLTIFAGLEFLIAIITSLVTLLIVNWKLGLIAVLGFTSAVVFTILAQKLRNLLFHEVRIAAEDLSIATQIENLQQVAYIRATFATVIQNQKAKEHIFEPLYIQSTSQRFGAYILFLTNFIYMAFFAVFGWFLFELINSNELSSIVALSLAGLYLGLVPNIQRIGNEFQRITESWSEINDSFKFIREFGVRSYPVLDEASIKSN